MKKLFILASVMVVLFLAAPNKVHAQRLTEAMKKQLAAEMVKNAEWLKACVEEAGIDLMFFHIRALSLSNAGGQQYVVSGDIVETTGSCEFGRVAPMHWIYEERDGKFRMLADLGACDSVQVRQPRTNGYLDIKKGVALQSGSKFAASDWKYNGTTYECSNCGHEKGQNIEELQEYLPSGSIRVPISWTQLIRNLGKNYDRVQIEPSGEYYIWMFRNGLEISAVSGEEDAEPFGGITFSTESQKPIPNCPFGFVLNKTTFNEVNLRFNKKLRKMPGDGFGEGFKVYAGRTWNHFYFKNKKLVSISIALWEKDKVN